jgi:hypothetical protein
MTWVAVFGLPVLWVAQLLLSAVLARPLCRAHQKWLLHAIALACAAIAGVVLIFCVRRWDRLARRKSGAADGETVSRQQFSAVVGVLAATFFFMLILASGMPAWLVDPCRE